MIGSPLVHSHSLRVRLGSALIFSLLPTLGDATGLGVVDSVWQLENNLDESNAGAALVAVPPSLTPSYTSDSVGGGVVTVLDLPALTSTEWIEMTNAVGGNGGSLLGRTNEWTIGMDVKFAALSNDAALLQTSTTNAGDAEIHVTSTGGIELGGVAIADSGTVQAGQWHRIMFTSEVSGGNLELKAYVDGGQTEVSGTPVTLTKTFDGEFALDATVPLFADDNAETLALKLHSLSYWGCPLTSTEIDCLSDASTPGFPDLYVTNNGNSGAGTLRAALTDVRDGGSIFFDLGLSGQTINLGTGGQLEISGKTLEVEARHLAAMPTINGADSHRIFNVLSNAAATIRGLTLTNGNNNAGGGAIRNDGTLTIIECDILDSDSSSIEGTGTGGGILNESSGTITIIDTTIADNTSDSAAGMFNAGIANLERCTISGNSAPSVGGIEDINEITMINCTVSGNSSTNGGGGGMATLGEMTLIGCTISNNEAFDFFVGGGGILVDFSATLNLENTIVAGNVSGVFGEENLGSDGFAIGTINYAGFNVTSGDPKLEPLANYGGITETMLPKVGSPAAATGIPTANTPAEDQRNFARIINLLDVGAAESPFDSQTTLFDAWAVSNIPQGQDRSFGGDPDSDLVSTGLEYAFRMDPVVFDSISQPLASPSAPTGLDRDLRIVIPYNSTATDLIYVVQETTDLLNWTEIYRYNVLTGTETVASGLSSSINTGNQTITVTDAELDPIESTFWRTGVILSP